MSYVKLMRFIELFTFSHGGNRNQQRGCVTLMWKAHFQGQIRRFDVAERYFDVHFQTSFFFFFFFNKKPFRPRVVLSRLFVCKIQPEVCGSVCECS